MKIYTQTWFTGNNYGSVLQAYALQHTLREMGHDCSVLNYHPTKKDMWKLKLINRNIKDTINYKLNELLMKRNSKKQSRAIDNLKMFNDFRAQNMRISRLCSTAAGIEQECGKDAVFICGSDQIWNPYFYDPYYYLEFVPDKSRKIAYAPSFGVSDVPSYQVKRITKALSSFKHISVREQRGAEIVSELTGKEATVAMDPTMLVSTQEWEALGSANQETDKYLFCYFLKDNPEYQKAAEEIARERGLKIRMLPMVAADFKKECTIQYPVGPNEWITLVKNASYVLTDSFHCSLFAIRFHKQFNTLQRFAEGDSRGQNSRIQGLLKLTGMQNRLIVPGREVNCKQIEEDVFQYADWNMSKEIKKSVSWLQNALTDCGAKGE